MASFEGRLLANRYQVTQLIGAGGMGSVYAAVEVETGRELALKALNAASFTSNNLRRFRREADVSLALRHKNLCRVEYLGVDTGTPFLVMERLHGETLRRRLRECGPPSVADAMSLMLQLLDGLAAAHAVGLMHRDVKPGNVFVTSPRGKPPVIKLIDFGLAKFVRRSRIHPAALDDQELSITETGAVPGTPFYLTPEQTCGMRDVDTRVDVWAAALTFYETLFGERLYEAESQEDLARSILFDELPNIHELRPYLPRGLAEVFATALAKNRDHRYASAAEFRAALITVWAQHKVNGLARGALLRSGTQPIARNPYRK
jgi:serine/threonine-protein kinase